MRSHDLPTPAPERLQRRLAGWHALADLLTMAAVVAAALARPAAAEVAFGPATTIETAAGIADIVLVDVDGDGDLDITALEGEFGFPATGFLEVLLNDGDGGFAAPQTVALGTFDPLESYVDQLAAGDLDGDGDPDLAFLGTVAPLTFVFNEAGALAAPLPTSVTVNGSQLEALLDLGDLDGDGDADAVLGPPGALAINQGTGDPAVVDFPSFSSDRQASLVELTGDGAPDIVYGNRVHVNDGAGAFTPAGTIPAGGAFECAFADFDGDGDADVACARAFADEVSAALNEGGGFFSSSDAVAVNVFPLAIDAGDLDGDGAVDLVVRHVSVAAATVLAGRGDGTFEAPAPLDAPAGRAVAVGDLDGDGRADVVLGVGSTFSGAGDGALVVVPAEAAPRPGDADGDGDVDVEDFLLLLATFGACPEPCPPSCPADFDADCAVGVTDLLILLANFGT